MKCPPYHRGKTKSLSKNPLPAGSFQDSAANSVSLGDVSSDTPSHETKFSHEPEKNQLEKGPRTGSKHFFLRCLCLMVTAYQHTLSPDHGPLRLLFPYGACRYYPTCSEYFKESVRAYGWPGVWLGLKRVARCHPGRRSGYYDPVIKPFLKTAATTRPCSCLH